MNQWDVFISYASEDKAWVSQLATKLEQSGVRVWIDQTALTLGDSLRQSIDHGLAHSRYGAIILSKAFFRKSWPQYELDGLVTKEMASGKTILPIWHGVSQKEVAEYSLSLANKVAISTDHGLNVVVQAILDAISAGKSAPSFPSPTRPNTPPVAQPTPNMEVKEVYAYLYQYFDRNELHDLAFKLGIDHEDLDDSTKQSLARGLAQYMERRNRMQELIDAIYKERPHLRS